MKAAFMLDGKAYQAERTPDPLKVTVYNAFGVEREVAVPTQYRSTKLVEIVRQQDFLKRVGAAFQNGKGHADGNGWRF